MELPELVSLLPVSSGRGTGGDVARAGSGNGCSDSRIDFHAESVVTFDNLAERGGNVVSQGNFRGSINLNVAAEEAVDVDFGDTVVLRRCRREWLDLNSGFDMNEGFGLMDGCKLSPKGGLNSGKGSGIDLNLDLSSDLDYDSREADASERKEHPFDLNVGFENEMEDAEMSAAEHSRQSSLVPAIDYNNQEIAVNLEVKFMDDYVPGKTLEVNLDVDDLARVRTDSNSADLAFEDPSMVPVEVLSRDIMGNHQIRIPDAISDVIHSSPHKDNACQTADTQNNVNESNLDSTYRRVSGRRRKRKVIDSTPETVLRRSARRRSSKNQDIEIVRSTAVSNRSSSPALSAITEEKLEYVTATTPKLNLPLSSKLDLDGISILDLFSVYSFLRSFSTILFLSPFDLREFVSALRSESPDTLFDCIHVSLLRTLRKHLEHLSSEGSASALHCLRSLNWDLLDWITWPPFLVEYLLLHSSSMKLSVLSSLKLFPSDYCKQPVSVKLNILQHLCDEVIEAEVIRSELNARSLGAESDMDFDRIMSMKTTTKRTVAHNSRRDYITEEPSDETSDQNSDECCLCKMDGNLICCDGCPAAYHSRCVGLVSSLLPEGDWYCPECEIERNKSQITQRRPLRGAEVLGLDPHHRLYLSCCDYLLVSDSRETEVPYKVYHKNDLTSVVEVLKSSEQYFDILKAIYQQWGFSSGLVGATSDVDSVKCDAEERLSEQDLPNTAALRNLVASSDTGETEDEKTLEKSSVIGALSGLSGGKSERGLVGGIETLNANSEGSAETTDISESQTRDGNSAPILHGARPNTRSIAASNDISLALKTRKGGDSEEQLRNSYINYYSFGEAAAPVVEELLENVKLNKDLLLSYEEIISQQMRAISKNLDRFYWPNDKIVRVQKEKCEWCFSCRTSSDEIGCLCNTYMRPTYEGYDINMALLQSTKYKSSHFIGVVGGILSIEGRLCGLLLGPWLNSLYAKKWRKSALEALDIDVVKSLLLKLASNLHNRAISEEWTKYEDSTLVLGSASHVLKSPTSATSKPGPGRKSVRFTGPDSRPSSTGSSGPGMFYWRGGRLSRHLFNWKVIPQSLASKAARQGGCKKIPGILYPENSDSARRSKSLAWQAAVESSTSLSQLALLVREFDSNIRWDDIENTDFLCKMDKELRKSLRPFKKVIIRRKVSDGNVAKYLLDFGKRRVIPEVVLRHGSIAEGGSSERKRYWLNGSLVPLHILKNFEEKRITRISKSSLKDSEAGIPKKQQFAMKMSSTNLLETGVTRKGPRERGFAYLFSRAERAEYNQCGHCKEDVLIREAVCCRFCRGFFHEWHVERSLGAITFDNTYICHKCQQKKSMKFITEKTGRAVLRKSGAGKGNRKAKLISERAKSQPQNYKKALAKRRLVRLRGIRATISKKQVQSIKSKADASESLLRRSARQAARYVAVQMKTRKGNKKGKQKKYKIGAPKRQERKVSYRKKRMQAFSSYWLNGLHLSKQADDERVMMFIKKNTLCPYSTAARRDKVKCKLCGEGSRTSKSTYIACETCSEWYHGEAFGLDNEKMQQIMGFKCHVCCEKNPPICPCQSHFPGVQNIAIVELPNGHAPDLSLSCKSSAKSEGSSASKKRKTSLSQD
ncbi:hypothetical protein SAY86_002745 [Trapa natans]|uniref:Uncharacterized protein n=1 Tax=Trapa natans TaxID=22666 RepID=A0AAN7LGH6_TRANT|nr:hypothetical protein SAY86_002745 [Trapa natans]